MSLKQFTQDDVPICEGFLCNEGVAAVVLKRVTQSRSFSSTLSRMEVTCSLYDFSEFLVCMGQADVRFLNLQCCELGTEIRLSNPEI